MDELHIALKAERITEIAGIPITNTLVTSWIVIGLLVLVAVVLRHRLAFVPGAFQTLIETIFTSAIDYIESVLEDRRAAERFFPLLITLFLFIFTANILEFTPGIGSILVEVSGHSVPLLRSVNTDLNVTLALAIISFVVIEAAGVATLGALRYGGKFVNLKSPLQFVIGLIELVSELARLVAFSFRLFGNIFAGEVLILVAMFFVPFIVPVPLMLFEVFVGFIQAAIFALLTLFFIKIAITDPDALH